MHGKGEKRGYRGKGKMERGEERRRRRQREGVRDGVTKGTDRSQ